LSRHALLKKSGGGRGSEKSKGWDFKVLPEIGRREKEDYEFAEAVQCGGPKGKKGYIIGEKSA